MYFNCHASINCTCCSISLMFHRPPIQKVQQRVMGFAIKYSPSEYHDTLLFKCSVQTFQIPSLKICLLKLMTGVQETSYHYFLNHQFRILCHTALIDLTKQWERSPLEWRRFRSMVHIYGMDANRCEKCYDFGGFYSPYQNWRGSSGFAPLLRTSGFFTSAYTYKFVYCHGRGIDYHYKCEEIPYWYLSVVPFLCINACCTLVEKHLYIM